MSPRDKTDSCAEAFGPLAGMRVIELSSFVAAPLGGMTLAQLGAEVIRVDPVGGAADCGRWPRAPRGGSLYWTGLNAGKRSVTADYSTEPGARLVRDLITGSGPAGGIVLTNARLPDGLRYDDLQKTRPDLIHLALTGRRNGGNAVDYTVNARCGFPMLTGEEGQQAPVNHVLPAWDMAAGLYIAVGLLASERRRRMTGQGQQLSLALEDVALATAGNLGYLAEAQLGGPVRQRAGNDVYGDFGATFQTSDRHHVMVVVLTEGHWRKLLSTLDLAQVVGGIEIALSADFAHAEDRYRHRHVLAALVQAWFENRSLEEVTKVMSASSLLWSPFTSFADLVAEPDFASNPLLSRVEHPAVGAVLAPGSPLTFDLQQFAARPAPQLGQNTDEVLLELAGRDQAQLDDLRRLGIIA